MSVLQSATDAELYGLGEEREEGGREKKSVSVNELCVLT
jgi:hypothetical protein